MAGTISGAENVGSDLLHLPSQAKVADDILSKLFLPRVGGAIEARAAKIEGDLTDARSARDEAERQSAAAAAELAQARARALDALKTVTGRDEQAGHD